MAEKRKAKQRKQIDQTMPSKEEYAVAKYLRYKIKALEAKMHGNEVKYFIASEAIDALLSSKWASGQGSDGILLTTRASCVGLMNSLLQKGCLFHRAEKVERKVRFDKKAESKAKRGKVVKTEKSDMTGEKKTSKAEEKKKGKKVRLQVHENQVFKDGVEEFYVWVYDPVSAKTVAIGLLLLLSVVAICLAPLWPPQVHVGMSYLSWIALGLLSIIFALYTVRLVVFVCIFCLSSGKRHFWLLPQLNEDVGFWESFVPLYDLKLIDTSDSRLSSNGANIDTVHDPTKGEDASAASFEEKINDYSKNDENAADAGGDAVEEDGEAGDSGKMEESDSDRDSDANFSEEEEGVASEAGAADERDEEDDLGDSTDNGFELLDAEEEDDENDGGGASHEDKKDK